MRSIEDCSTNFTKVTSYSYLEKSLPVAKCADALSKTAEFLKYHKELFEKAGKLLGVAVPSLELVNDIRELREDVHGIEEYTKEYPERSLEAAKRLDEAQKDTLNSLSDCQQGVIESMLAL
jgi:hypothetical protein